MKNTNNVKLILFLSFLLIKCSNTSNNHNEIKSKFSFADTNLNYVSNSNKVLNKEKLNLEIKNKNSLASFSSSNTKLSNKSKNSKLNLKINSKNGSQILNPENLSIESSLFNKEEVNTIFWEGWVKYSQTNSTNELPSYLLQNNEYFKQISPLKAINSTDDYNTFSNIPDKNYFYLTLHRNFISISATKDHSYISKVDSLDLKMIKPFEEIDTQDSIMTTSFFNETNCFLIKLKESGKWLICTINSKDKIKLIENLIKNTNFSLKSGIDNRDILDISSEKKFEIELNNINIDVLRESDKRKNNENVKLNDGYWQLLQDWSQCSLKCDGGESLQQWLCIPPRSKGSSCKGESILIKKCNIQPCPVSSVKVVDNKSINEDEKQQSLNPIVKIQYFSSRPQRYEQYKVLEKDVYRIKKNDKNPNNNTKVPIRIVINKNTISGYQNDDLNSALFTFVLKDLKVNYHKDYCCLLFNFQETICGGFGDSCGTQSNPLFVNQFLSYIHEFQNQFKEMTKIKLKAEENEIFENASVDIVKKREDIINSKIQKKEEETLLNKASDAEKSFNKVFKREYNFEKLIEEEEKLKVKENTKLLLNTKKKAEDKKKCLEKVLKLKKIEAEQNFNLEQEKSNIEHVKQLAIEEVQKQRETFKERIMQIRKKASRKYKKIEREISIIRNQMTDDMIQAKKLGTKEECIKNRTDLTLIKDFCDKNLILNPDQNLQCKIEDNFCSICCEIQFGVLHIKEGSECLSECENEAISKEANRGSWSLKKSALN